MAKTSDIKVTISAQEGIEAGKRVLDDYLASLEPSQAVRLLVAALGVEEQDLRGLQINPRGTIRVLKNDFSSRTVKFDALKRKVVQS